MPRRIAFINEKGGSAKTTLVANLGAHLALHRGRRVLAIDLDPQGQLARVLGVEIPRGAGSSVDLLLDEILDDASLDRRVGRDALPHLPTRIPGLDVVAGGKALGLTSGLEVASLEATGRLARALDALPEVSAYDYVLLDAPPSFGPLTLNVLRAADALVVPVPLTWLALDGCAALLRTVESVRHRYEHPDLRIALVVPTFYRRTRLAGELLDRLKARFPKEIAHTVVGHHVKIDEAQARGLSIFEYAPRDRSARAMAALAEELELREPPPGAVS